MRVETDVSPDPANPNEPISPEELVPLEGDERVENRHREAELLQRARHLAGGRELHQREREAVLLLAREGLDMIESATRELMEQNLEQLPRNLSDRVRQIVRRIDPARAGLTASTLVAPYFVRAGFKSIAATSPIAGTLAGTLIGGAFGAIRGYLTEKKRQFSPEAIKAEYDQIRRESGETHALAFLRTMLAEGDLQRSDFSGRLQLIALFLAEGEEIAGAVTEAEADQDNARSEAVREILADTIGMRENYHSIAKSACIRAMWPAAKKGMVWGAGFGLASDLISWFAGSVRAETAAMEHRETVMSGDNTFRADFHDNPPSIYQFAPFEAIDSANLEPTDFGNMLSRAFNQGLAEGKIQITDEMRDFFHSHALNLNDQQISKLVSQMLHHAQPLPEHTYFYHGQDVAINWDALNKYLETAFANGADTTPEYLAEQLMSADSIISSAQEQIMTEGAAQAAAEAAKEGVLESATHSTGIAAGAIWGSRRSTPEPGQGSRINLDTNQEQGGDTGGTGETNEDGGDEPPGEEGEETDDNSQADTAEETEAPDQTEPGISYWSNLFEQNRDQFKNTAEDLIDEVGQRGWENLKDEERKHFISLCAYMQSTQDSDTKIIFTNEPDNIDYRIADLPTENNPQLKLTGNDNSEANVDLTNNTATLLNRLTIKIIEP